jgi:hypothetical protein
MQLAPTFIFGVEQRADRRSHTRHDTLRPPMPPCLDRPHDAKEGLDEPRRAQSPRARRRRPAAPTVTARRNDRYADSSTTSSRPCRTRYASICTACTRPDSRRARRSRSSRRPPSPLVAAIARVAVEVSARLYEPDAGPGVPRDRRSHGAVPRLRNGRVPPEREGARHPVEHARLGAARDRYAVWYGSA